MAAKELEYIFRGQAIIKIAELMAGGMVSEDVKALIIDGCLSLKDKSDEELMEMLNRYAGNAGVWYQVYTEPPGDHLLYNKTLRMTRLDAEEMVLQKLTCKDEWDMVTFNFTVLLSTGFKGVANMSNEELEKFCMDTVYRDEKIKVVISPREKCNEANH